MTTQPTCTPDSPLADRVAEIRARANATWDAGMVPMFCKFTSDGCGCAIWAALVGVPIRSRGAIGAASDIWGGPLVGGVIAGFDDACTDDPDFIVDDDESAGVHLGAELARERGLR